MSISPKTRKINAMTDSLVYICNILELRPYIVYSHKTKKNEKFFIYLSLNLIEYVENIIKFYY